MCKWCKWYIPSSDGEDCGFCKYLREVMEGETTKCEMYEEND